MKKLLLAALLALLPAAAAASCINTTGALLLTKIRSGDPGSTWVGCVNSSLDTLSAATTVGNSTSTAYTFGSISVSTVTGISGATVAGGANYGVNVTTNLYVTAGALNIWGASPTINLAPSGTAGTLNMTGVAVLTTSSGGNVELYSGSGNKTTFFSNGAQNATEDANGRWAFGDAAVACTTCTAAAFHGGIGITGSAEAQTLIADAQLYIGVLAAPPSSIAFFSSGTAVAQSTTSTSGQPVLDVRNNAGSSLITVRQSGEVDIGGSSGSSNQCFLSMGSGSAAHWATCPGATSAAVMASSFTLLTSNWSGSNTGMAGNNAISTITLTTANIQVDIEIDIQLTGAQSDAEEIGVLVDGNYIDGEKTNLGICGFRPSSAANTLNSWHCHWRTGTALSAGSHTFAIVPFSLGSTWEANCSTSNTISTPGTLCQWRVQEAPH